MGIGQWPLTGNLPVRRWALSAIALLATVITFISSPALAQLVLVDFDSGTDAPLSLYVDQGPVSRTFVNGEYRLTSAALGTIATSLDTTSSYVDFSARVSTTDLNVGTPQEIGLVAYASTTELDGYTLTYDFGDETLRLSRLDDGVEVVLAQAAVAPIGKEVLTLTRDGANLRGEFRSLVGSSFGGSIPPANQTIFLSANDSLYGSAEVGVFVASPATNSLDATVDDFAVTSDVTDSDADLVVDVFDNCVNNPNGPGNALDQVDHDGDGYGTSCDCDFTQDGVVLGDDMLFLFGMIGHWGVADITGDGIVLGDDILFCFGQFNGPPG